MYLHLKIFVCFLVFTCDLFFAGMGARDHNNIILIVVVIIKVNRVASGRNYFLNESVEKVLRVFLHDSGLCAIAKKSSLR